MQFKTPDMSLSAYLLVTRKLPYLRIEVPAGQRQAFVCFDDPDGKGPSFETEFLNGAVAPASDFHQKLRYIRRKIDTALSAAARAEREAQEVKHA